MTNQQKWTGVVVLVIIIAGIVWWGSSRQQAVPETGEPIKIGAIFMLSGTGSFWGENSQKGADLAVAEINEAGGVNGRLLKIVYEDNQGDNAKEAVSALNKFLVDGIDIFLGPNWTPSGLATAPIACSNNMLGISPTLGVAGFNEECDFLFNLWVHDDIASARLGSFLAEQGVERLAILGSLQEWDKTQSEAVRSSFEEDGGTVVSYQLVTADQPDFRSEVAKIRANDPEAIVLMNYAASPGIAAKQIREARIDVPIYSIVIGADVIESARGALEGAIAITTLTPTSDFVELYKSIYGIEPDIGADTSYDAVMLIAQAMRETKSTDSKIIKNYLNSLESYDGASGQIQFDGKGGVLKEPHFTIVRDNQQVPYDPAN